MNEMTPSDCWMDGCDPEVLMVGKFCRWCHVKKPRHAPDCAVPPWEADRKRLEQWEAEAQDKARPQVRPMTVLENAYMDLERKLGQAEARIEAMGAENRALRANASKSVLRRLEDQGALAGERNPTGKIWADDPPREGERFAHYPKGHRLWCKGQAMTEMTPLSKRMYAAWRVGGTGWNADDVEGWMEEVAALEAHVEALEKAIQKALDDEETGKWGPDVTVVLALRAALAAEEKP